MQKEENIHELANRYFEGKISRADEKVLFEYITQDMTHRIEFKKWEKEWIHSDGSDARTEKEWKRLQCKIHTQEAITSMWPTPKGNFLLKCRKIQKY